MKAFLKEQKQWIISYLEDFLKELDNDSILPGKNHYHALQRLCIFTSRGKMLRGALVSLGYQLFHPDRPKALTAMGASIELMQSALLVHDDIMDLDQMRRGETTVYYRFVEEARREKLRNADHIGEALGICTGDLAFFMAYEILADLDCSPSVKTTLLKLFSREMTLVGLAQMDDVRWGAGASLIKEEEILSLYRHKTGRYTYSLPLAAGAILAERDPQIIEGLMKTGELMGILFQIKDDELGLIGNEEQLGKPVGSDVMEGKKTLHYMTMLEVLDREEKQKLSEIYGNPSISPEDLQWISQVISSEPFISALNKKIQPLEEELQQEIEKLSLAPSEARDIFLSLIQYNQSRSN